MSPEPKYNVNFRRMYCISKVKARGKLISEKNFGVFKSPQKMNQIFEGFLP